MADQRVGFELFCVKVLCETNIICDNIIECVKCIFYAAYIQLLV